MERKTLRGLSVMKFVTTKSFFLQSLELLIRYVTTSCLLLFRYVMHETLSNNEKSKVEEAIIEMMDNNKLAPIESKRKIQMICIINLMTSGNRKLKLRRK